MICNIVLVSSVQKSHSIAHTPARTHTHTHTHTHTFFFIFFSIMVYLWILNIVLCAIQWASLVVQMVKNPPAMQETWVQSLSQEDPLEKGMATHSSILAWRIPWIKEPGRL